ncbi:melanocyte-stimulating hormone receptor-like [Stylophora pistillata]|uniref:melanocyte-stimulating hormone receptor-like n=1 Tax=Stylophora pistillata TaxID=50429 RepID=UPI000C049AE7|nr:melanocyte-stimulating hormone receptor-like [Stylophora pistillata]
MAAANITESGTQTKTFERSDCSPFWVGELKQQSISFTAVNIFLSITAFLGNSLILVALRKESSLHPPSKLLYRCLAITDLLVGLVTQPLYATYWMAVVHEHWSICQYSFKATGVTGFALCSVSLSTITAISVDRLLAMLLGLRYKETVTLRRTYVILAIIWVLSLVAGSLYHFNHSLLLWCGFIFAPSCLVISIASYTKIFRALSRHQAQVQDHAQQQPSQTNALNMARNRKAVYSALWVLLALVFCYVPNVTVDILLTFRKNGSPNFIIVKGMAVVIAFFNSTLNPFLYCWRNNEVSKAVKQTIRQAVFFA